MPPTVYSYGQDGAISAENDGGAVTDYICVDGRPIAEIQPSATPAANQIYYVLADRLGTPQQLVNSSGSVVWSTAYQPFGTTGAISSTASSDLRFPGQITDGETGFSYYIQLYQGNASLLAESLEVIQQTASIVLAALGPPGVNKIATQKLTEVAA